jgi:hypothetical protein
MRDKKDQIHMASEDNTRDRDAAEGTGQQQAETQLRMMWDDANIQRVYIDAANVIDGLEEIVLLFGMKQSRQPGEKASKVQISDRIVLSPFSAKRLSILLSNVLQNHDQESEKLDVEARGQSEFVAGNTTAPERHQDDVPWDETHMISTYANATEVTRSREAINILFGVEPARQAGQNEVRVQPSRHVAMRPSVAKRLAIGLNNAVRNHETTCPAPEPVSAVDVAEENVPPQETRDASGAEARVEKVLTLFRQLGRLDVKIDFEHSFKVVHSHLFADRFLLGMNRREMEGSRDERITLICEHIGMPHNLLASFKRALPNANHVYFGIERNEQTLLYKAYLEFRDKIEKESGGAPVSSRSFRLFTGFKWDAFSPTRQVVTRYAWYPSLPVAEIFERLRTSLEPSRHSELLEVVRGITKRASEKISHSDIQYLEVTEDGNPRRSFDINIYKSGLRIEDVCPYLLRALRHYAIPFGRFEPLYQRIRADRFGHLAGGVDRENKDFMTVYCGVKAMHSSQFGSATIVRGDRLPHASR